MTAVPERAETAPSRIVLLPNETPQPLRQVSSVPLGLTGFAINFFIITFSFTGSFGPEIVPLFIGPGFALGACMIWVGTHEFKIGNMFPGLVFSAFGAYWIGTAFIFLMASLKVFAVSTDQHAMGVYFIAWTGLTIYLTIGCIWIDMFSFVIFVGLLITLILFDLWAFADISVKIGAWTGVIDSIGAFVLAGVLLVNEVSGRIVVPTGPSLASVLGGRGGRQTDVPKR